MKISLCNFSYLYASFRGRIDRYQFVIGWICLTTFYVLTTELSYRYASDPFYIFYVWVFQLFTLFALCALSVKRGHDRGHPWWVPTSAVLLGSESRSDWLVNIMGSSNVMAVRFGLLCLSLYVVVELFGSGSPATNRYGPPPTAYRP